MSERQRRRAEHTRTTRETDVRVVLDLDGSGVSACATGVPFLDHMLTAFAKHGRFDLTVQATGDLAVDDHHTVEDVGLVLGMTFAAALGDGTGIARFGTTYVPMDDALARVVVDCAARPYLVWAVEVAPARVGSFDPALAEEFWRAVAMRAGLTLHVDVLRQRNAHHALEAIWKAAGVALHAATRITVPGDAPSTKGVLG
ncbi:MAG: imidazoleglycerol-phosphate dehydratase HisB [Ktedonobacterales bacterium]|nr:imidazoleglycerol-phosphate dehydratase HisB [Ktedonobacterales bacterium]